MRKKFKKLRHKLPKARRRKEKDDQPSKKVPRITNQTVASHREEIINSARKYIYPLQHSKNRIVLISVGLSLLVFVGFFTYAALALYRFQSTTSFTYRITQVLPFPIARAGSSFVPYENYLFELRRYTHYYENQLGITFEDPQYTPQLEDFKRRALNKVVNDAYVEQLARENNVSVSNQEVEEQIEIVRSQNRLGGDGDVFESVLNDYWGWEVDDFRRSLRQEILTQKVVAELDQDTWQRAEKALNEINSGKDFAKVAAKYSDDESTKENGGEFGYAITRTDRNLSAQTTRTLFELEPGESSEIINTGYTLEIVKNIKEQGNKVRGARILFLFKDISTYLDELKEETPARLYISPPDPEAESSDSG